MTHVPGKVRQEAPTVRQHDLDASTRSLGEEVHPKIVWVRMKLRETVGKIEQMSANGCSPVEIFKAEHEASVLLTEVVRGGYVDVEDMG